MQKKHEHGLIQNMRKMQIDCQNYTIYVNSIKTELTNFLAENSYTKIAVLVDENTKKYCLPLIWDEIDKSRWTIIEVHSGESHKQIKTCELIWKKMLMAGLDRHSLMVNLGGGVIGDMGGFCASTYMRGIDFVHIPTTLLSQVDSSVGGKLGVDLEMVKNIVGMFASPKAVFVDKLFLQTLPTEQIRSGFAEMVKHGLIADTDLWNQCKDIIHAGTTLGPDPNFLTNALLEQTISVKKRVVEKDPYEAGLRKILNYGHTIGHAVETESWNTAVPLLHGEAIFVGMICENHISYCKGKLSKGTMEEVNTFLQKVFYRKDAVSANSQILQHMQKDKKNKNNRIYSALLQDIGSATFHQEISQEEVLESFQYYKNL